MEIWAWMLLAFAALIAGLGKTALPGSSTIAVVILASVLPARTSTAAMLLLFIVGDVFALIAYRRHADWRTLLRLAPAVVVGLLVGAAFLAISTDGIVRRTIGVILLAMVALTLWRRRRAGGAPPAPDEGGVRASGRIAAAGYGTMAGFTTMVANSGGPVMSMYFLATRTPVKVFLGTSAWFFAIVNLTKVPFLAGIGLLTPEVLLLDLTLAPMVVIGALIGIRIARRMPQRLFDRLVIALTIAGSVYLLF
ncbi:sulfite exporter TauE/SafE family protein [Microbacterium esteraromaticum]|uniref:Probable membrane transporter protein n=1 Tax=Microbacterium esteraromaticum TaxID=57043 RepID=A0A7D7WBZ9_9MICO|nr:sulfite exporter TauE/SafE family protein [Microbacterium esteraromaticum]QMU96459.1 sulfite exporter TauE/SafE family protein [Microbacterium esteraromaticum]